MTGFEYFSLLFFILLPQKYKDTPIGEGLTLGFCGFAIVFMFIGK